MPTIQEWRKKYAAQGLKVVAVHAPRQEDDTNIEAVHQAIQEMGIEEPCAIDNMHNLVDTFQNQYWPAYYLFDKEGALRSRAAGDAGIKLLEGTLTRLMEAELATIA
jgi:thiol-disulfide isomerase/thioredoxin